VRLTFVLSGINREIADDDTQWLISELLAANQKSGALGRQLQLAAASDQAVETSTEEKRKLLQVFARSTRPRSHELRALEIALHADVFENR
jgi:hypothetical protein